MAFLCLNDLFDPKSGQKPGWYLFLMPDENKRRPTIQYLSSTTGFAANNSFSTCIERNLEPNHNFELFRAGKGQFGVLDLLKMI